MSRAAPEDQFSDFVVASWSSLYRTAYLLLGDHAKAEDLVQTALAKTYASWHRVREIDAAPAYARQVLVNTASSWFRRRSWRNERPTEHLPELATSEADPSLRPSVSAALATLPPRQRAVVVLRYYEDLDVAETAAALGISTGTVKSQTSDGLAKLRLVLGDDVLTTADARGAHHD